MVKNRKLKVYGDHVVGSFCKDNIVTRSTVRVFVAVSSKAELVRIFSQNGLPVTPSYVNQYFSQTFNKDELATALSKPGVIFCHWDGEIKEWLEVSKMRE